MSLFTIPPSKVRVFSLAEGDSVSFEIEQGAKGPSAVKVKKL